MVLFRKDNKVARCWYILQRIKISSTNKKNKMKKIIGMAMIIAFHSAVFAQSAPPGSVPGTTPGMSPAPGSVPATSPSPGVTPMPGANQTTPNQGVYPNSTPGTTPGLNNQNNNSGIPGSNKTNNISTTPTNSTQPKKDTIH